MFLKYCSRQIDKQNITLSSIDFDELYRRLTAKF